MMMLDQWLHMDLRCDANCYTQYDIVMLLNDDGHEGVILNRCSETSSY